MYENSDFNQTSTGGISSGGVSSWLGHGSNSGGGNEYVNSYSSGGIGSGGIGSQSYTSGGGSNNSPSYNGGGGKYKGMGNPMMNNNQTSPSQPGYLDTIKGYVPDLGKVTSMFSKKPYGNDGTSFLETDTSMGSYQVPVVPGGFQSQRNTFASTTKKTGWEASPTSPVETDETNALETKLVEEFTSASGVKIQPTRTEVSQFVSKCSAVDGQVISELLHRKLKHKQWQVRLKALCAVEALLRSNNDAVTQYYIDCYNEIGEYTQAVQDSVASMAKRIIKILDQEEVDEDVPTPTKKSTPITPIEYESQEVEIEYHKPVVQEYHKPVVQEYHKPVEKKVKETSPKQVVNKKPTPKPVTKQQKELSPIFDPYEDDPEPEPEPEPQIPQGPKPITSIDDIFNGMSIHDEHHVQNNHQPPPQPERKRADSAALMNDINRFFDAQPMSPPPSSPSQVTKNLQQYPPSTLHQPQIVYVPVPMMQQMPMMQPMMQPVMSFPMGAYPMNSIQPMPMMQQRMMPNNNKAPPQTKGGFDFMNKSEETETDIHFDFVKAEIAQSTPK